MHVLMVILAAVAMSGHQDAYIISVGNNSTLSGATVADIVDVHKRMPGQYIWVRRGGCEYVIADDATRRQALALFAPQRALEPEQEAVGREERRLDREADWLEDKEGRLTPAEKQRLAELREQLRVVARRERELDEREERLERDAERQFWPLIDTAIRSGQARPLTR